MTQLKLTLRTMWLLGLMGFGLVSGEAYSIDNAPDVDSSDEIQIFYLEAPFPYNTPVNIVNAAGSAYNTYGTGHAGLGIWDTTTDDKFTIEFVSSNYVGGLLPDTSDNQITWKNVGSIVVTFPLVDANWKSSRLITTTIGSAYSQLITYLQDNRESFNSYQPITGLFLNTTTFNPSGISNSGQVYEAGSVVLTSTDSYWFVDRLIDELSKYGCDLESFLSVYASNNNYLTPYAYSSATPIPVIEWQPNIVNMDVYYWYSNLSFCYETVFNDTVSTGLGAQYFLEEIKSCYGEYAYVFRSNYSVYRLDLHNYSAPYSSPYVSYSVYALPGDNSGSAQKLAPLDYIMIAIAFVAVIAGVAYFAVKFLGKKKRRRVSYEGERIAENIVGPLAEIDHDDRAYYHGRGQKSIFERMNLFSPSKASTMKREPSVRGRELSDNSLERPLTQNEC